MPYPYNQGGRAVGQLSEVKCYAKLEGAPVRLQP